MPELGAGGPNFSVVPNSVSGTGWLYVGWKGLNEIIYVI